MIALIHGPDAAIARAETTRLAVEHDPAGAETSRLDGRETALPAIIAAIGSAGFFGGGRVVVVHDLMARSSRGKGAAADDDGTDAPTGGLDLTPLFAAVPPENLLILVDAGLLSVPAAVKRAAPRDALVIAAEPPRGRALLDWIAATARAAGGDIDPRTAQLLAETLYPQTWSNKPNNPRYDRPPDTDLLRNEIEKLVLAAHPDPIAAGHIRSLVGGAPDDRIFRFVEAADAGNLAVAVVELERLLAAGEEPAKLLAQIDQQIELGAVLAAGSHLDPIAAGRAIGLSNPNRMGGIAASRRGLGAGAAFAAVANATETDRALKRGRLRRPEDALYAVLAAAANRIRGGT